MKFEVRVELEAWEDLDGALAWFEAHAPALAADWYDGLMEGLRSLAASPQRCPLAPENAEFKEEIRQLLYGRRRGMYRILFTIRGRRVHVVHVRHGARQHLTPEDHE